MTSSSEMPFPASGDERWRAGREAPLELVDLLPMAVLRFDCDSNVVSVNAGWTDLTGRPNLAEVGRGWLDAVRPEEQDTVMQWVRSGIEEHRLAARDTWVSTVIGQRLMHLAGQPHCDHTGHLLYYVLCATDVTEEAAREIRLTHAASHDFLTGLLNRAGFLEQASRLASEAASTGRGAALLLLDLDDFKAVNDAAGHPVGDGVLRTVAHRLRAALRPGDVVARIGGDEFAVVLVDVTTADAACEVADRILSGLLQPVVLQGHRWSLGASIGVDLIRDECIEELLERADASLYAAKGQGKGAVAVAVADRRQAAAQQRGGAEAVSSSARTLPVKPKPPSAADHFHSVHFYHDDDDLLDALVGYVGAGLFDDCVTVIATPEHRRMLRRRLDDDRLATARAEGRYVELDAEETLGRFMRAGLPDAHLFEMVVGTLILRGIAKHGGVRAFGEMVAVLWADGQSAAALRLEDLWNELQQRASFPLLCAYPLDGLQNQEGDGLARISHRHTQLFSAV